MQKQISREFYKYISLNVLGMLGLSCYILADTFFISKRLGADGLTALNLAISVYPVADGCLCYCISPEGFLQEGFCGSLCGMLF